MTGQAPWRGPVEMTDVQFRRFAEYIASNLGIRMPPGKKKLLQARLQRRLRELGMACFDDYAEYVFSQRGLREELHVFVDTVTTNTTHFFREPKHFDLMVREILPGFMDSNPGRPLRMWSAGCSSGEEPYGLAMLLSEYAREHPRFSFSILATDISSDMLAQARRGVYGEEKVEAVPEGLVRRYMLRSRNRERRLVRMAPEVRRLIRFERINFMEPIRLEEPMDVIFCRNVVIYFDRPTQQELFAKLCANLRPGGHLFIGHSESLMGMGLPVRQLAPSAFVRV